MIINTEMPRMFLYNTEPLYQGENDDEKILLVISLTTSDSKSSAKFI